VPPQTRGSVSLSQRLTQENLTLLSTSAFNLSMRHYAWDTSRVTDMSRMFHRAPAFDQSLASWQGGGVENQHSTDVESPPPPPPPPRVCMMGSLRTSTRSTLKLLLLLPPLRVYISIYPGGKLCSLAPISVRMLVLNDPAAWITSSVTTMSGMFYGASAFNQALVDWNTMKVTAMVGPG